MTSVHPEAAPRPAETTNDSAPTFEARAVAVGDRIDLRALTAAKRVGGEPIAVLIGEGVGVFFRYGVAVFFRVPEPQQRKFLQELASAVTAPVANEETETLEIRIDPARAEGLEAEVLNLPDNDVARFQIVAEILARSVALAKQESQIAAFFGRVEPLALELQQTGRAGRRAREILRHIGEALLAEHQMIGRVEVIEKPALLWDRPDLERLFARLESEFEIRERHMALERKIQLLARTAETSLDLLQNARSLRVEWYIVALIVFEILLTLYQMWTGTH